LARIWNITKKRRKEGDFCDVKGVALVRFGNEEKNWCGEGNVRGFGEANRRRSNGVRRV